MNRQDEVLLDVIKKLKLKTDVYTSEIRNLKNQNSEIMIKHDDTVELVELLKTRIEELERKQSIFSNRFFDIVIVVIIFTMFFIEIAALIGLI